jgi:hypothetical protein
MSKKVWTVTIVTNDSAIASANRSSTSVVDNKAQAYDLLYTHAVTNWEDHAPGDELPKAKMDVIASFFTDTCTYTLTSATTRDASQIATHLERANKRALKLRAMTATSGN